MTSKTTRLSLARYFSPPFRDSHAWCLHLLFAAFVFSDFFLGRILISGLDMVDFDFPFLLAARRNFAEGSLGLWNPYLLSGTSAFAQSITPLFSPKNWLLFLLPTPWLFLGMTFLCLVQFWLVGGVSYALFREETSDRRWAFLASSVYQLSGFAMWTIATSESLSLFFVFTLILYLLWTLEKRSAPVNFSLLTLCFPLLLYSTNITHEAYAMLALPLFYLYRVWSTGKFRKGDTALVALSWCLGIMFALPKWLPTWSEIQNSSRLVEASSRNMTELNFLGVRLFIPEIFGVSYWASFNTIGRLSEAFKALNVHIYAYMPHYFGAIALFIVILYFRAGDRRLRFWGVYVLALLLAICAIEPLHTLLQSLAHPLYHIQSLHLLLPVGFCFLLAHAGTALEREPTFRHPLVLKAVVGIALLYAIVIWTYNFAEVAWLPFGIKAVAIAAGLTYWSFRRWPSPMKLILVSVAIAAGAAAVSRSLAQSSQHSGHVRILAMSVICLGAIHLNRARLTWGALALLLAATLTAGSDEGVFQLSGRNEILQLAFLGTLKFALLASLFWKIVSRSRGQAAFAPLILLVIMDLLPLSKVHTYLSLRPFYSGPTLFPARQSTLDLENYRVNHPNLLAETPLSHELYRGHEGLSDLHVTYRVRSYGGYVNTLPRRYQQFVEAFSPRDFFSSDPDGGRRGFRAVLTDERFLDLSAVGYSFDPRSRKIRSRPSALSRFQVFEDYEVVSKEDAHLARLKDPGLSPQKTVLLFEDPGFASTDQPGRKISAESKSSDQLALQVRLERPALLLFNDSYHEDWRARVDGTAVPVLRANYNFMAVALPAGAHSIRLSFEPRWFYVGVRCARAGAWAFVLILGFLLFKFPFRLPTTQSRARAAGT